MEKTIFPPQFRKFSPYLSLTPNFITWILRYLALCRPKPIANHLLEDKFLSANLSDAIVEFLAGTRLIGHIGGEKREFPSILVHTYYQVKSANDSLNVQAFIFTKVNILRRRSY